MVYGRDFRDSRFTRHHNLLSTQGKPSINGPINKGKGKGNTAGKGHGKGNGAGGGAEPAFWVRTYRVAMDTAAGTQSVTVPGLSWTPKAMRVIHSGAITDGVDVTTGSSVRGSVGAYDGTDQWNVAWRNSVDSLEGFPTAGQVARAFAAGSDRTVTASGFIAGGVSLTLGGSSNASFLTFEFFGGTAFQAKAGIYRPGTLGNVATISVPFEMEAFLSASSNTDFGVAPSSPIYASQYASWDGTTIRQAFTFSQFNTPGGTRTTQGYIRTDGATVWLKVENVQPTAFDVRSVGANFSTRQLGYLAMNFGGAAQAWVGVNDTPTATGSEDVTGVPFQPVFGATHTTRLTAIDAEQTDGQGFAFALGSFTDSAQYSNHWRSTDAAGSGGTVGDATRSTAQALSTLDHRSLNAMNATFTKWNTDGLRRNFTAVPASACKEVTMFIG